MESQKGAVLIVIGYVYVVTRDYGFAPNPFYGYCTLATCKPFIRKGASIGDWIIGIGSKAKGNEDKLVYLMEVNEIITFDQYWETPIYLVKKPVMNGSLKQHYGDNIYHHGEGENGWVQENSHHSNEDGTTNIYNLQRDTRSENVLISTNFYYFGKNMVRIPIRFQGEIKSVRGYKKIENISFLRAFLRWATNKYESGYSGDPLLFEKEFKRYDGVT